MTVPVDEALEILELSLVPGLSPACYNVGLAARRITFADQQRRSINLVWALLRERRVEPGDRIAIVGGGVSGATAADYASRENVVVDVFEKHSHAFAIQQGSGRWIHPNIYDWPLGLWRDPQTRLPCMNWEAGTTNAVIRTLREQWREAVKRECLTWHPSTEIVSIDGGGDAAVLEDASGNKYGPFRCLILAVGFGEEPVRDNVEGKPYWRDDDLHQRLRSGGTALVSGCGDGGLVDTLRVLLSDFQHGWVADIAQAGALDEALVSTLSGIERQPTLYPDGEALTAAMRGVTVPSRVTSTLRSKLQPNTKVILNGRTDGPLGRKSCLLNRFLVAQLMNLGAVEYRPGMVSVDAVQRSGDDYIVQIGSSAIMVQQVVIRHGPSQRALDRFPSIREALAPARSFLQTYSAGVDRTRRRHWNRIERILPQDEVLPPNMPDVLRYIGQETVSSFQQQLVRDNLLGTIGYQCSEDTVVIAVRLDGSEEQSIEIHCRSECVEVSFLRDSCRLLSFSVDPVVAPGEVTKRLEENAKEILSRLLEEPRE